MKKLTISACMPIWNEQAYLPYSLYRLKQYTHLIDEFVFVLDRCTDKSEVMVRKAFPHAKIIVVSEREHQWKEKRPESFQIAFSHATKDIIYSLAADIIVDPQMFLVPPRMYENDPSIGTICFRYYNYTFPVGWTPLRRLHEEFENKYKSFIENIRKLARHSGCYCFRKDVMEELGGVTDFPSEYDEFFRRVEAHDYKHVYLSTTKILHLRPGLAEAKQKMQGRARVHISDYNLAKTLLHSFIHLKPHLITSYIQEKRRVELAEATKH